MHDTVFGRVDYGTGPGYRWGTEEADGRKGQVEQVTAWWLSLEFFCRDLQS